MIRISARGRTDTGFDVVKGLNYKFTAVGYWWDFFVRCDASGYSSWLLKPIEKFRQHPSANWFSLMGEIGDTTLDIGHLIANDEPLQADIAGRLYCYPNDLSAMRWNNWGSVQLSIAELPSAATEKGLPLPWR